MYLFLEKKGYFTFGEIMQFLFLCNVSISVQQNMEVLERSQKHLKFYKSCRVLLITFFDLVFDVKDIMCKTKIEPFSGVGRFQNRVSMINDTW